MSGSTLVIVASSKEEILQTLREDVYAKSGVWDVDKVRFLYIIISPLTHMLPKAYVLERVLMDKECQAQMWPLKCAFRIPVKQ